MADTKLTGLSETSVPALADVGYFVDVSDTTDDAAGSSRQSSLTRILGLMNQVCQGRLTLTSGTAITTSDVTGATSVYWTPYNGNMVSLYDGTRWRMYSFSELTLALGTITSVRPYDVFLYDNAGTLTLELLAWTSDTARATALVLQDGVWCKTGALTRRYLGTFRTTSTTQTEDSLLKRFLWNAYNRVSRPFAATDGTDNWTYNTATWRQARAQTANKAEIVLGLSLEEVFAVVSGNVYLDTAGEQASVAVGVDSTTTPSGFYGEGYTASTAIIAFQVSTHRAALAVGYHYLAWLEIAHVGTVQFNGDDGGKCVSGLTGDVWA